MDQHQSFKCPEGEQAFRDPSNDCEFFPCPVDKDDEKAITTAAFHIPASSPSKFPELPKPTLPHIVKPTPYTPPAPIDLGKKKPSGSSDIKVVNVSLSNDVKDDGDESAKTSDEAEEGDKPNQSAFDNSFEGFSSEEWYGSGACMNLSFNFLWAPLAIVLSFFMT